jgi:hypothetical protein
MKGTEHDRKRGTKARRRDEAEVMFCAPERNLPRFPQSGGWRCGVAFASRAKG